MTKSEELKNAIIQFEIGYHYPVDYLNLFYAVHSCTNQGSGLLWSDVIDVIKEALEYVVRSKKC